MARRRAARSTTARTATTPWGTYLTCEENWAGYFRRIAATDNPNRTAKELASFARYGVAGTGRELWATVTPDTDDNLYGRWNAMKLGSSAMAATTIATSPNTFGWVVEIDPFDADFDAEEAHGAGSLRARRRMARAGQGRRAARVVHGRRFAQRVHLQVRLQQGVESRDANGGLAAGDKYLDDGQAVCRAVHARRLGSVGGAHFGINGITAGIPPTPSPIRRTCWSTPGLPLTPPAPPRWIVRSGAAVHPTQRRGLFHADQQRSRAASDQAVDAANPRFYNDKRTTGAGPEGQPERPHHSLRRRRQLCRCVVLHLGCLPVRRARQRRCVNVNVSGLTDANDFSSPDGLWFSRANPGLLWIQTDDGAYTDVTNCMMLAAVPGKVGDGEARS